MIIPDQNTFQPPQNQPPQPQNQLPPQPPGLTGLGQPLPPPQPIPQNNLEQNTLNSNNKQQISNFMSALQGIGAGSNNSFMNVPNQPNQNFQNLINPSIANLNNANNSVMPTQQSILPNSQVSPVSSGNLPNINNPMTTPIQYVGGLNNLGQPPGLSGTTPPGQNGLGQILPVNSTNNPISMNYLSTLPLVSDENQKTNIQPSNIHNFLSNLGAWDYQYKEPHLDGIGTFTGPMAQELEKTPIGQSTIINTPRGKMVDTGRLTMINTSAQALLHQQQQSLKQELNQLKDLISSRFVDKETNNG